MNPALRPVRWVFGLAAAYGVVVLVPLYFAIPVGAPEYYYGFIGAALVTQGIYYRLSREPERYAPMIPLGIASKLSFAVPCAWLLAHGRLQHGLAVAAGIDALLAIAFAWCWWRTARERGG